LKAPAIIQVAVSGGEKVIYGTFTLQKKILIQKICTIWTGSVSPTSFEFESEAFLIVEF
jgi:hypothetical protein